MITILKASAGSGKTFRLAKTYIEILLKSQDPFAYRHILAVTFTNKATAEMKSRILKELDCLAKSPEKSDYIASFRSFMPIEEIQKKASRMIGQILHDYSAFAISTIDKFFQQALKAFAREVGQAGSYQVELDRDLLVEESVDRILDGLTDKDKQLLDWLRDSVLDGYKQGRNKSLDKSLYTVAKRILSEEYNSLIESAGINEAYVTSKEYLSEVKERCERIKTKFETELEKISKELDVALQDANMKAEDFNGGKRSFVGPIVSYHRTMPELKLPTNTQRANMENSDKWLSKKSKEIFEGCIPDSFGRLIERWLDTIDEGVYSYNTALIILSQIYTIGLAAELKSEFRNLLKEKNVLGIEDSNEILRKIISGSDAPFIYEKLGVRYNNFLLDEFQDTSVIQWENFLPLIGESNSSGGDNLIVGDVKQSIYRWRGSDWNLLDSAVKESFNEAEEEVLDKNFRSSSNVVKFNNSFFSFAAQALDELYGSENAWPIYETVSQNVTKEIPGHVQFTFCGGEESETESKSSNIKKNQLAEILSAVRKAYTLTSSYRGTAILVRGNDDGAEIAAFLVASKIPVISDDSLDVKSSMLVRQLVSLLHTADNPNDSVNAYLSRNCNVEVPSFWSSLTELCEDLYRKLAKNYFLKELENQAPYIHAFMDYVCEWSFKNGNNLQALLKDWEDKSLSISSPADADAVRILTIHKSKGLEFPYVIFPFAEKVELYKPSQHWCVPFKSADDSAGQPDEIYSVNLSAATELSNFCDSYYTEQRMQHIDNINIFYVALTRAETCLHVISAMPSDTFLKTGEIKNFSHLLYSFLVTEIFNRVSRPLTESFSKGDFSSLLLSKSLQSRSGSSVQPVTISYPSYPIGNRLRIKTSAADYFSDEEHHSSDSARIKGIVLHDILSRVFTAKDVVPAVRAFVSNGIISAASEAAYIRFLRSKLKFCEGHGWFSNIRPKVHDDFAHDTAVAKQPQIINEGEITDTDGNVYRPDRVVIKGSEVDIIDYKFGKEKKSYHGQVSAYMSLYRRMGYEKVRGWLWYVLLDKIVQV